MGGSDGRRMESGFAVRTCRPTAQPIRVARPLPPNNNAACLPPPAKKEVKRGAYAEKMGRNQSLGRRPKTSRKFSRQPRLNPFLSGP